MLARVDGLRTDQLLTDLLAVRRRLEAGWLKGGFRSGENVCIMAALNSEIGLQVCTFNAVRDAEDAKQQRLGTAVLAIYSALYGPEAPTNITVSQAGSRIARFNDDGITTKESVLLLIDRAIQIALAPAVISA